jgi:predicted acyl esterase
MLASALAKEWTPALHQMKSEIRDGMKIDWDAPIEMDDGVILRADVFRPVADGQYPVILSYGPYAKGLAMQEAYKSAWLRITAAAPEVLEGSSNKYQNWELFDPEKWVPDGYVLVRVDSRGAGRSEGFLETWSPREANDIALCVDWAGAQPWSNGKVGLHGISYYSMNQWQSAPLKPKHLAAICIWEGSSDYYRELCRHGGILSDFYSSWYPRQVTAVQHGVGARGFKSAVSGEPVAGPETLTDEELVKNRADCDGDALRHRLLDEYHRARLPKFDDIETPLFSAANWGGMGLHTRGNFEGYLRAAAKQKWLEVHGDTHFTLFYAKYGQDIQRQFFDRFLKGTANGWEHRPKVLLNIRHPGEKFVPRAENEWPLARTQWTKFYLHPDRELDLNTPTDSATLTYATSSEGATFSTDPLDEEMEITGPVAVKLFVSSDTTDADLFLVLRVFDPDGREVVFVGTNDPRVPVGLGWLRASHRKLDPNESSLWRPWHTHDEEWPLTPGEPVELDIEIWPTCIVVPKGYRIALTVRGKDYEYDGTDAALPHAPYPMKGVGPFTHTNPKDRPPEIFGGKNTLHFGETFAPYILLPIIPKA